MPKANLADLILDVKTPVLFPELKNDPVLGPPKTVKVTHQPKALKQVLNEMETAHPEVSVSPQEPAPEPTPPAVRMPRHEPLTQKARGLQALRHKGYHGLPFLVCIDPEDTDDQLRYKIERVRVYSGAPAFARPAPLTPRHGFVDSRPVTTPEELRQVWNETLAEDLNGEVIVQQFLAADYSAVVSQAGITWAKGHTGATNGEATLSLPLQGFHAHHLGAVGEPLAGIPAPENQMVELVWTKDRGDTDQCPQNGLGDHPVYSGNDAYVVQCREGAAGTGKLNLTEYLPGPYNEWQGHHIYILNQGKEDMLQWPKRVMSLPPDTLIFHHGGSVLSHWGYWIVQANAEPGDRRLAYVTDPVRLKQALVVGPTTVGIGGGKTVSPKSEAWLSLLPQGKRLLLTPHNGYLSNIGSTKMLQSKPIPDFQALPFFTLGYTRGLTTPIPPHHGARRRLMLAAILVQNGLLLHGSYSGCYALGWAVAMLLRGGVGACVGEYRHRGSGGDSSTKKKNRPKAIGKALGRWAMYDGEHEELEQAFMEPRLQSYSRYRRHLPEMIWGFEALRFPGMSYGGPSWADSARVLAALDTAVQGYLRCWKHPDLLVGKPKITKFDRLHWLANERINGGMALSMVIHHAHALLNQQHNSGLLLDKVGLGRADMTRVANSDLHVLTTALPAIGLLGLTSELDNQDSHGLRGFARALILDNELIQPLIWG